MDASPPPRIEVMGDLRLLFTEARVAKLEAELANRKFLEAARAPIAAPVEPLHGWEVE